MAASKRTTASRLSRCVKAPVRMLCRACDLYVRTMTSFGSKLQQGGGAFSYYAPAPPLPRSFSVHQCSVAGAAAGCTSRDDDLRELVRAASVRVVRQQAAAPPARVPRSQSVAIGRIDEDRPCEFGHDVRIGGECLLPRGRSYKVAPAKGRLPAFA